MQLFTHTSGVCVRAAALFDGAESANVIWGMHGSPSQIHCICNRIHTLSVHAAPVFKNVSLMT